MNSGGGVASSPPTMAAYVIISTEDGSSMEVPLEMDHTLSLVMLQMAHPKTTCVKYRNPDTGLYRLIAPRNGLIHPPPGGWGSHCFIACTISPALEDRLGVMGDNNRALLPPAPPRHLTGPVVPKMSSPAAFPSHQMPSSSSSSFLPRQSTSTSWLYGSSTISNGPPRQPIYGSSTISNGPPRQPIQPRQLLHDSHDRPPRQPVQPRFPVSNSGGASFYPSSPYHPEPVFIPRPVAPSLGARPLVTQPTPIDAMTTQQPGDKYRLRCNLCNIEVGSAVSLEYHYAGKRHQSNLRGGNIGGSVTKTKTNSNRSSHRAGVQHRTKMAAKAAGRTIGFIVDGG